MSILALIHPTGLSGIELRESLELRRDLWQEMLLLTTTEEELGTLTEVRGAAAMVTAIEENSFDGVDVAFFCGGMAESRPVLEALPSATAGIMLAPDAEPEDGHPIVAGVNLETATRDQILISPHPGTVVLAHLLYPLLPFGPRRATATLLQPVSVHGKAGLDELFEQTRSILTFDPKKPHDVFAAQVAFNVTPAGPAPEHLGDQLRTVLKTDLGLSVQTMQAGIFHGCGVSLHVRLDDDPGAEECGRALADHLFNEIVEDPELLGPIDAAGRAEVLVGEVRPDPGQRGGYWIWAVMDNLTCGGALNAIQILEAVGRQVTH
ncbi:MAG: hypothetical protein GY856_29070 [bacterium]|nr:hypothetical protein [bacterium]